MSYIPSPIRRLVTARATNRCEYCSLSQEGQEATFHIDHIRPQVAGGETVIENLALSCVSCSLRKADRRVVIDPLTNEVVPLYNPRKDIWSEHFRWEGVRIIGLTSIGRATVIALEMNRPQILAIRQEEVLVKRHPPSS